MTFGMATGRAGAPNGAQRRSAGILARVRRQLRLRVARALEYAKYESAVLKGLLGCSGLVASLALRLLGRRAAALQLETSLHRNAFSPFVDGIVEGRVNKALSASPRLEGYIENLSPERGTNVFFSEPTRMLGHRIIVVKAASADERGALILDYSFVFSLFLRFFDVERIAERYYMVVEPSWSGACDRDILALAGRGFPVFVQSHEPRDIEFMERFGCGLVPVGISANWWVDPRVFRPLPDVAKDADVLMNSAWARFKRHEFLFAALARLRARGKRLRVILAGYPMDMSRDDIAHVAMEYGVLDQLEIHERLRPDEINRLLNRVKVNLVWSRREGSNRAIIEGFFAGTPAILREGFNYGHRYPFINEETGVYCTDGRLPECLLQMTEGERSYAPRRWVENFMSPQVATQRVDEAIARYAASCGERWTTGRLAVKVTSLDSMAYWDERERSSFEADYALLRSSLRDT